MDYLPRYLIELSNSMEFGAGVVCSIFMGDRSKAQRPLGAWGSPARHPRPPEDSQPYTCH